MQVKRKLEGIIVLFPKIFQFGLVCRTLQSVIADVLLKYYAISLSRITLYEAEQNPRGSTSWYIVRRTQKHYTLEQLRTPANYSLTVKKVQSFKKNGTKEVLPHGLSLGELRSSIR